MTLLWQISIVVASPLWQLLLPISEWKFMDYLPTVYRSRLEGNTGPLALAALPPECQAMRRCRRSARRFAPLLALASTGAPRRRRPGSAALRGYGLLGRRHDERPPFGGLVLCGVADGHIQERAATAGAHIRLHVVRLKPY